MPDELLDYEEARKFLGVGDKVLRRLLQDTDIPARKLGNQWRFSKDALIRWVAEGRGRDYTSSHDTE
jgi:excisionase family DNA binding protein